MDRHMQVDNTYARGSLPTLSTRLKNAWKRYHIVRNHMIIGNNSLGLMSFGDETVNEGRPLLPSRGGRRPLAGEKRRGERGERKDISWSLAAVPEARDLEEAKQERERTRTESLLHHLFKSCQEGTFPSPSCCVPPPPPSSPPPQQRRRHQVSLCAIS